MTMKTKRQMNAFVGAAGVHAVASRLFLAGRLVYFPTVDEGVDLMLGNGLRIQVKCGNYRPDPRTSGRYYVLNSSKVCKYRSGEIKWERREYADAVDFVIFWAIDENRFFVFPAERVTKGIYIPSRADTFLRMSKTSNSAMMIGEFEESWHLLDVDAVAEAVVEAQVLEGV